MRRRGAAGRETPGRAPQGAGRESSVRGGRDGGREPTCPPNAALIRRGSSQVSAGGVGIPAGSRPAEVKVSLNRTSTCVSRNSTTIDCTRTSRKAAAPPSPTDSSSMDLEREKGRSRAWALGGARESSDCSSSDHHRPSGLGLASYSPHICSPMTFAVSVPALAAPRANTSQILP